MSVQPLAGALSELGVGGRRLAGSVLGHWTFDEASGTRADSLGRAPLVDVLGNVGNNAGGKIGSAATFTAASKTKLQRNADAFRLFGDFTISAWIFPTLLVGADSVIGRGIAAVHTNNVTGDWMLAIGQSIVSSASNICFGHWRVNGTDTTGLHRTTTRPVVVNQWQHVVARRSGGVYSIWHNGASLAFADTSTLTGWSNSRLIVGSSWVDPSDSVPYYFDGRIDEPVIFRIALSDAQIAALYNSGAGITYPYPF